jgi:hypothetical protein
MEPKRKNETGVRACSTEQGGTDTLLSEGPDPIVTKNFRPSQRVDVKRRLVDGEMIVLDRDGGLVHQLNRTATYIWKRCNGQYTPAEIAAQLCEMFEVDQETALRDVVDSIRQLRK